MAWSLSSCTRRERPRLSVARPRRSTPDPDLGRGQHVRRGGRHALAEQRRAVLGSVAAAALLRVPVRVGREAGCRRRTGRRGRGTARSASPQPAVLGVAGLDARHAARTRRTGGRPARRGSRCRAQVEPGADQRAGVAALVGAAARDDRRDLRDTSAARPRRRRVGRIRVGRDRRPRPPHAAQRTSSAQHGAAQRGAFSPASSRRDGTPGARGSRGACAAPASGTPSDSGRTRRRARAWLRRARSRRSRSAWPRRSMPKTLAAFRPRIFALIAGVRSG